MATMKAVRLHEYGGADKLIYEEAPMPTVGDGEMLIKVHASSVNPVDWKLRSGMMQSFWPLPLPVILGADSAGEVVEIGPNVTGFSVGDAVYGFSHNNGGYAEYVSVPAAAFAKKPESLDFLQSASVPVVALTAYQGLFDYGKLQAGQTVLVQGASGGVGMFAVQLAKNAGTTVFGTASTRNADFVRSLGVDTFVDYTAGPFEAELAGMAFDLVFDTVGAETATRSLPLLKSGGILSVIAGEPSKEEASKFPVQIEHFGAQSYPKQLTEVAQLFDAGKLRTEIAEIVPLANVAHAHELSETGRTRGKIVIQVI